MLRLAFLLASIGAAPGAAESEDSFQAVVEQVQPFLLAEANAAQLTPILTRGGPDAIPDMARLLDQGRMLAAWRTDGGPTVTFSTEVDAALIAAIAAQPRHEVLAYLESVSAAFADEGPRRTAMRVLAEIGKSPDVQLLVHLASPPPESAGVPRSRRLVFEEALCRILDRDPEGKWVLKRIFTNIEASLLGPVVRSISTDASAETLSVLAGLLGRAEGVDALILLHVAKLGEAVPQPIDEGTLGNVRFRLSDSDRFVAALAIRAIASLGDYESIPNLISHVAGEDELLCEAADRALERISMRTFHADPRAWEGWYTEETDWWARESVRCFKEINSTDSAVAIRAIREASTRRLYRHDLSRAIAPGLDRQEPEAVRLTAATLGALGSRTALQDLIRALDRSDPVIVSAALAALQRITRLELPADPELWKDAI